MKKTRHVPGKVAVRVKGKNITVTPALHDQVVNKMQKLDKYLDRLTDIEVELACEQTRDSRQHNHCEATTRVLGHVFRVASDHEDMYAAIDGAVDKLYRQLNRQKERMKAHHGGRKGDEPVLPVEQETVEYAQAAPNGASDDSRIYVTHLDMKPQFEDEAIEELRASGQNFFVFLNARDEQVNVIFVRDEGGYGLIRPQIK